MFNLILASKSKVRKQILEKSIYLSKEGKKIVTNNYNLEIFSKKIIRIIEEII